LIRTIEIMIKGITKSTFVRNFSQLFMGSVASQIMPIVLLPLLTRLYTAGELGAFAIFYSVLMTISPLANGRLDVSIVMAEDNKTANVLAFLSFLFCIVIVITIGIIGGAYLAYYEQPITGLLSHYWIIMQGVVLVGFSNIQFGYSNRLKLYNVMSIVTTTRTTIQLLFQVVLGWMGVGLMGLIVPLVGGYALSIIYHQRQLVSPMHFLHFFRTIKVSEIKDVITRYAKQPLL